MILAAQAATLYHASYTVIEKIDLVKCGKLNDFGQKAERPGMLKNARRGRKVTVYGLF